MPTATEMQFKREDLNPCTIQFNVVCSPDQVKDGFAKAYKEIAKQVRVPGFRPGTAPKAMIDKMVDPRAVAETAAENIINQSIRKILMEEKIQPHDSPAVNLTKLEKDSAECEYTAKVPLAPIIELGDYKGLPAEKSKIEVTDEEVNNYLEELRLRAGKREAVTDRGAQDGDAVVVNLKTDGSDGEGRSLMAVVGKTFKALDDALHGMRAEEMKVCTLDFPADFQNSELAGKKQKVRVALKSISALQTPALDDAFAQSLDKDLKSLKSENLDSLKAKLRERLEGAKEEMAAEYVNEQLQSELLSRSTVHVPDTMWENVAGQRLREIEAEVRKQGQSVEDYAKSMGMSIDDMVASWKDEAKVQVQRAVIAREIFVKEKMKLSNEDLNQMVVQMAYEYQVAPQVLIEAMQKNKNFQELEIRAVYKKVLDFLNQNAEITEGSGAAPKKAKAKSAEKSDDSGEKAAKPKKTAKK